MWTRWVSSEWRSEGFHEYAYEVKPTGKTVTADGMTLYEVNGRYVCEDEYCPTRKAAMIENYEELRLRLAKLTNQCEALRQEIEKEGNA